MSKHVYDASGDAAWSGKDAMPNYCVNRNVDHPGDHEVHDLDSTLGCLPAPANRLNLGQHASSVEAVAAAQVHFPTANGCRWCASLVTAP